jgi:hypothetical protein
MDEKDIAHIRNAISLIKEKKVKFKGDYIDINKAHGFMNWLQGLEPRMIESINDNIKKDQKISSLEKELAEAKKPKRKTRKKSGYKV